MFEDNTYKVILDRMLSRVSDKLDKREGSVIYDTHSPTALELQFLYIELERIVSESFGDTASREFLARRCAERGITAYPASYAVLKGVFLPSEIDVLGKRFSLGENNYIAEEKIENGIYKVRCENEGTAGNKVFGTLIPIDYIDGLETGELTELLIPGEDEEETEALRKRYFDSFNEKSFGGNVKDYIEKTCALGGVGSVKVTRVWNGDIRPADMIPSDKVKSWYIKERENVGEETAGWLDTVYSAAESGKLTVGGTVLLTLLNSDYDIPSEALIKSVQNEADPKENTGEGLGFAPIGHCVTVRAAEGVEVNVEMSLAFEEGYSFEGLRDSIEKTVGDYLLELRREWADSRSLVVRIGRIEAKLLGIKGVLDTERTLINGKAENLLLGEFQSPVLGTVKPIAQKINLGGEGQ